VTAKRVPMLLIALTSSAVIGGNI